MSFSAVSPVPGALDLKLCSEALDVEIYPLLQRGH
jgi:hypothetical protein